MILRTIFRAMWVVVAFGVAVAVALLALFALGGMWVGEELRAAAPGDPVYEFGSNWIGAVLFAGTVTPALTILPALAAAIAGEALKVRSWMYYVLAGGAALAAVPLLAGDPASAGLPAGQYMTIFAAAGFAGGFVYWLLAGRSA
jgi:hypothetical protein